MPPVEFMKRMKRLLRAQSASEVVAFYDQHGDSLTLAELSHTQRMQLAEIMHWADTVVELQAAEHAQPVPSARRSAPTAH